VIREAPRARKSMLHTIRSAIPVPIRKAIEALKPQGNDGVAKRFYQR